MFITLVQSFSKLEVQSWFMGWMQPWLLHDSLELYLLTGKRSWSSPSEKGRWLSGLQQLSGYYYTVHCARKAAFPSVVHKEFRANCKSCRVLNSQGSCLVNWQLSVSYCFAYWWSANKSFDKGCLQLMSLSRRHLIQCIMKLRYFVHLCRLLAWTVDLLTGL